MLVGAKFRIKLGLFVLLCYLATNIGLPMAQAQSSGNIKVEFTADPDQGVLNETDVLVTIKLTGDSTGCPVRRTEQPLDVVLLMDVSSSMNDDNKIDLAKTAVGQFIRQLELNSLPINGGDQVGLVVFSDSATEISPLTQDLQNLSTQIDALTPSGGTNIADGIENARQAATDPQTRNDDAQPAIVLLSDGDPSVGTVDDVIFAAQKAKSNGVRVITIGLGDDVKEDLLRTVASRPQDYYKAPTAAQLSQIYQRIAREIQPRTAATDIELSYQFDPAQVTLDINSINPPPIQVTANTIAWNLSRLENVQDKEFTFRIKAQQVGNLRVGQLVNSSFAVCDTTNRAPITGDGPVALIQQPTPTPLPTNTPTPLPTNTPPPTATPTPPSPGAMSFRPATVDDRAFSLCGDTLWWLPWLLLALLVLAFLILRVRPSWNNMVRGVITRWCFLTATLFGAWVTFVIWLFLLPFFASLCQPSEVVYFWRRDPQTGLTGIYQNSVDGNQVVAVTQMNSEGCSGCHTVSRDGKIASVNILSGSPPAGIKLLDPTGGTVSPTLRTLQANFLSFSPDGKQLVYSDANSDLHIVEVATGVDQALPGASDPNYVETMPTWGPNGKIAFARSAMPAHTSAYSYSIDNIPLDIYTVDASPQAVGQQAQPLTGATNTELGVGSYSYYPTYCTSADTSRQRYLAFTHHDGKVRGATYANANAEIWIVPIEGGQAVRLRANDDEQGNPIPGAGNSWPSWSLDCTKLAFNTQRYDSAWDIYVTDIISDGAGGVNSDAARPLTAAAQASVFEHLPFWGTPIRRADPVQQALALWPFLLPLLPLFLLMWAGCSRCRGKTQIVEPTIIPSIVRTPPPGGLNLKALPPLWSPQPTIIIGLGETGQWVLTHLKKILLDANLGEVEKQVGLLALDIGEVAKLRDEDNPIRFADVELNANERLDLKDDLSTSLDPDKLKDDPLFREWLTREAVNVLKNNTRLDLSYGAKKERLLARAGFLLHLRNTSDNFFTQLQAMMQPRERRTANNRVHVVIVGDTFGDIGSAVLLDVALLAREAARKVGVSESGIEVSAHLLTDSAAPSDAAAYDQINTGATLREIERFQLAQARPFPIYYPQIESKVCDYLPIDELMLYDGTDLVGLAPAVGIYPALADTIGFWIDTSTAQGKLAALRNAQLVRLKADREQVLVFSHGIRSIRLPFADLLDYLRFDIEQQTIRDLVMGHLTSKDNEFIFSEQAMQENYGERITTSADLARAFLRGKVNPSIQTGEVKNLEDELRWALVAIDRVVETHGASGDSETVNALQRIRRANGVNAEALTKRLINMLGLLLNGRQDSGSIFLQRGGKLAFTQKFIGALENEIKTTIENLTKITDESVARDSLKAALETLAKAATSARTSLAAQIKALGLPTNKPGDQSLIDLISRKGVDLSARRKALDQIAVRTYIWDYEGRPLVEIWREQHLKDSRVKALRQLYWEIDGTETISINLRLTLDADDASTQTDENPIWIDLKNDLSSVAEFEKALTELATRLCNDIRSNETTDIWFNRTVLRQEQINDTQHELLTGDDLQYLPQSLTYDRTQRAAQSEFNVVLGGEKGLTQGTRLPQQLEQGTVPGVFIPQPTTQPYVLTLLRRIALIPVRALNKLETARAAYRDAQGLSNNPRGRTTDSAVFTAVHEAEAVSLRLERILTTELRRAKKELHPLVATALTNSRRTMVYSLAIAAGDIEVRENPTAEQPDLVFISDTGEDIVFERLIGGAMNLYAQGLMQFIVNETPFTDEFVETMYRRYTTDTTTRKQFAVWLKTNAFSDIIDSVPANDRANFELLNDMMLVARLYARQLQLT